MNNIVRNKSVYSFEKGLDRAKKRLAYYQEGMLVETAARIIDAMESSRVSRSELARRLNVSPAYITKILRGQANLSLDSLAKLAFALDLKWECILIPKTAQIGLISLNYGGHAPAIRSVETATIEGLGQNTAADEAAQYAKGPHYELRLSA